jgi:hypothetical protein
MQNQNEQDIHIMANLLKTIPLFETLDEQMHGEIIKHAIMEYYPVNASPWLAYANLSLS